MKSEAVKWNGALDDLIAQHNNELICFGEDLGQICFGNNEFEERGKFKMKFKSDASEYLLVYRLSQIWIILVYRTICHVSTNSIILNYPFASTTITQRNHHPWNKMQIISSCLATLPPVSPKSRQVVYYLSRDPLCVCVCVFTHTCIRPVDGRGWPLLWPLLPVPTPSPWSPIPVDRLFGKCVANLGQPGGPGCSGSDSLENV